MNSFTKLLLVGAVALAAMAVSVAPSEAAKKKRAKASAPCVAGLLCSTACARGTCKVNVCGIDGKWYRAAFTPVCSGGVCPPACR
jgi:hypothetical protein